MPSRSHSTPPSNARRCKAARVHRRASSPPRLVPLAAPLQHRPPPLPARAAVPDQLREEQPTHASYAGASRINPLSKIRGQAPHAGEIGCESYRTDMLGDGRTGQHGDISGLQAQHAPQGPRDSTKHQAAEQSRPRGLEPPWIFRRENQLRSFLFGEERGNGDGEAAQIVYCGI
jgi:hypothetical protein